MWLILLTFIAALPFGVLFFLAIRGLHRARQLAKQYLPLVQEKAREVAEATEKTSQKIANPIIGVKTKAAQVNGISQAILARRKNS
jgi:hypothetical protein